MLIFCNAEIDPNQSRCAESMPTQIQIAFLFFLPLGQSEDDSLSRCPCLLLKKLIEKNRREEYTDCLIGFSVGLMRG